MRLPAVKNVEKHSVFQCLRKTGPKLGPMLGGGTPKSRIVFLEPAGPLWADTYGGKKVGGAAVGRGKGRDLHTASSPP